MNRKNVLFIVTMLGQVWVTFTLIFALNQRTEKYEKYINKMRTDMEDKIKIILDNNLMTMHDLQFNLGLQVSLIRNELYKNQTITLNNTRNLVDAAVAEGKDVEHCFAFASHNLDRVDLHIMSLLLECANKSSVAYISSNSFMETIIEIADELNHQMDNVIKNCIMSITKLFNCITHEIQNIKHNMKSFDTECGLYDVAQSMTLDYIRQNMKLCTTEVIIIARKEIQGVKIATEKCINKAPENIRCVYRNLHRPHTQCIT